MLELGLGKRGRDRDRDGATGVVELEVSHMVWMMISHWFGPPQLSCEVHFIVSSEPTMYLRLSAWALWSPEVGPFPKWFVSKRRLLLLRSPTPSP